MPTRRRFLSLATQGTSLLAISVWLPAQAVAAARQNPMAKRPASPTSIPAFQSLLVTIHADNRIVFNLSKQEMGQGVSTGYAMIFADELGASLALMEIVNADYNKSFSLSLQGITGGSSSIPSAWQPLREAAAEVRIRFTQAAAKFWGDSSGAYTTHDSQVIDLKKNRRVSFGELIPFITTNNRIVPVLRPASEYRYIGKSVANVRLGDIISGRNRYGIDVVIPGMLYACIERSPVFLGKASTIDDSAARMLPGVVDVFHVKGFQRDAGSQDMSPPYPYSVQDGVAVIATNTWAAIKGRKALKIVWDGGRYANTSDQSVTAVLDDAEKKPGRYILSTKDGVLPPSDETDANQIINASYDVTFQAHALMEPLNTVCHVTENSCEVWSGHQFPRRIVEQLSPLLSLTPEQITVHVLPSGGGFGRRWEADFVVEAALLSKHMRKPVKCMWTREDEIRHDYYHGYERHLETVTLDQSGVVSSWHSRRLTFATVWHEDSWNPYMDSVPARSLSLVELEAPVQLGPWRSVSPHRNTFSRECIIDRIAMALKKDPLEFRLEWLRQEPIPPIDEPNPSEWVVKAKEERTPLIRVLERAKTLWPAKATGVGIAITTMSSTCAHIAHVEMDNNRPRLRKVDVVVYCGRAINPSLVRGQFEGSVIWALQAIQYGGVHLKEGRVAQSNFHDYKMIRMPEVPEIQVHLIESNDPPRGTGEPGVPPLAPAMANAILQLTGKQPTSIPFEWNMRS
jgi:isoquinoline 1-oxidoreductase beta subunit